MSVHDTTGTSPFYLLLGRVSTLPLDIALSSIQEHFIKDVAKRSQDAHAAANARIEMKQNYVYAHDDHPDVEYKCGDFVMVYNPSRKKGRATKLLSRYCGPYRVIRKIFSVNYEAETQGKCRRASFVTHDQ